MKIKIAKDYWFDQLIYESDLRFHREACDTWFPEKTYKSDYNSIWKEEDVTLEQLQEYIDKGYAIKINC